jgi:predicted AAA+ superfamily ATPase
MLINKVKRSDIQGKKVFAIGEKYYFNDLGIRNAVVGFSPFDLGLILENAVYLHLKQCGYHILVGKMDDKEVDFIAEKNGEKIYIQVAMRITEEQTMKREFGNLSAIKDNFPKYVITLDEYSGASHQGIIHISAREFLYSFK